MKNSIFLKILFYCLIAMILQSITISCVKENLDDCDEEVDYNLILYFEYLDPDGNNRYPDGREIFSTRLQTIDVLIYNANHRFYKWINCDNVTLSNERSKKILVDPGEYYIIGWANDLSHRDNYYTIFPTKTFGESYIYHDGIETADPLHYTPDMRGVPTRSPEDIGLYGVNVKQNKVTEHTLPFMSAHRTLNIYLRGFPEIGDDAKTNPELSVNNLSFYYDSYLNRGNEVTGFVKTAGEKEIYNESSGSRELLGYAGFYVPHFDNENNVTINITAQDASLTNYNFTVKMTDVLKELKLEVEDGDDITIDILIEFKGTYVQIKVPDWEINNVGWK